MVGPGKLRDETDGKLRASLEGRPPGREPASHLPAGSPLSFVLWVLPWKLDSLHWISPRITPRLLPPRSRQLGCKIGGRGGEPSV